MLLYKVSEKEILTNWSIETIIKKVEHGFDFILMQHGISKSEDSETEPDLKDEEILELYK